MRYRKRMGAAIVTAVLTVSCIFPSYGTKTDMDAARESKSNLENEKKEIEKTIEKLEVLKSDTASYVNQLDAELNSLNKQVTALNSRVAAKEAEIEEAEAELAASKEDERRQYESMKLRIQYMYEKGETSYLDLLFKSADLTQLFNRAEYISQIAAYDRKMLDQYEAASDEVAAREADLKAEHEELVILKTNTEEKQKDAERLMNEKTAELNSYNSKIAASAGSLSELEKDIAAQEDKIKAIEAEIRRKEEEAKKAALAAGQKYNTVSIGNINFIWPCPSSSRITSSFGDRESPTEGASSSHQGVDIGASTGSSILAAASGTVTISTYSYSAGNYIMINHGGGVSTVYMHCSELLVSAGQEVTQGQVIAKVGSTGYSTGPHLHFGIRVNGSYVNPINYVSP